MRKRIILLLLLIGIMVLGACAPAAVEEAAPAEEAAVVEEVVEEEAAPIYGEPTLVTEGLGVAADLEPTSDEIAAAIAHLTDDDSFVGIVACTYSTDYHSSVPDAAVEYAESVGIKVETFDSEIDVEKQISGIENFVSSGADVIIVCVFDPPSVESALKEAAD